MDPGRSDPEGDARRDAESHFDAMSYEEMVALACEALCPEDHANAVWSERHKLCAHLEAKILAGEIL